MKNLWPKMALLPPVTTEKYNFGTVSKIFRLPFTIFQSWTCMNNAGLDERDTLLWWMRHGKLKLLSTWIFYMSRGASGAKGPGTQRHRRTFSWKSCNQATLWTWHVHHSGLADALMTWGHPVTPRHEFSHRSSEENEHHTTVASIFLHFV